MQEQHDWEGSFTIRQVLPYYPFAYTQGLDFVSIYHLLARRTIQSIRLNASQIRAKGDIPASKHTNPNIAALLP
jgi:hypothetical protein